MSIDNTSYLRERGRQISNLTDLAGKKVGSLITNWVLDPETENIVVLGEPGIGKSTIIGGLDSIAKDVSRRPVTTEVLGYEEALKLTEEREGKPRRDWNNADYDALSDNMWELINRPRGIIPAGADYKRFIETVSVRGVVPTDKGFLPHLAMSIGFNRAVITMVKLSQREEKRSKRKTRFLAIPADFNNQRTASDIREESEDFTDDDLVDFLEGKHIKVVGIDTVPNPASLLRRIIRSQAIRSRLEDIAREVYLGALDWSTDRDEQGKLNIEKVEAIVLPDSKRYLNETQQYYYMLKAAYMEHFLRDIYKVPSEWGMTVFNPYDPEGTIYWNVAPFLPTP